MYDLECIRVLQTVFGFRGLLSSGLWGVGSYGFSLECKSRLLAILGAGYAARLLDDNISAATALVCMARASKKDM